MSTESLAVVAIGFSAFALVVVVALAVRVGRLMRAYDALAGGHEGTSFVDATARSAAASQDLQAEVQRLREDLAEARRDLSGALCRVAVVRYDAFGDLAGSLSFSAALLDDEGNGLVLSSINGRSETRTYAKGVSAGTSEAPLSPEEQEAIAEASRGLVTAARATS